MTSPTETIPHRHPKVERRKTPVTVTVTVKNTPPDSPRLAAQRDAIEVIFAALARD